MPEIVPGLSVRKTPRGVVICELDYWADPDKRDPAWIEGERKRQPSYKEFRREYLRDWTSPAGDAFFPEFTVNGGRELYAHPTLLLNGPILRAWDFGVRFPACLWMQRSKSGRLVVLREWMPDNIDVRTFRDVVLFLSGQADISEMSRYAVAWLNLIADDPRLPSPPWFTPSAVARQWIDVSGPEANYTSDMPEADTQERTRALILAEGGIQLNTRPVNVETREDIIRELLKVREDGFPGIIIDTSCNLTLDGLSGGIAYPKPSPANPIPTKPSRDGYYEHIHDCLGYGATFFYAPVSGLAQEVVLAPIPTRGGHPLQVESPQSDSIFDLSGLASRHW